MSTQAADSGAARQLTMALVATIEHAAAARPVLREAIVAALSRAFAPADLQVLVAELTQQQRALCETARQGQLAAATAGAVAGDLERARLAAEAAVQLDFTNPESHQVLGEILEASGSVEAAHTEYVLAMHLGWEGASADAAAARTCPVPGESEVGRSPEEERYHRALALGISCLERRDLEHAGRHARAAVTLEPSRPEGFNLMGVLAELAGRRGEARTHYRVAAELDPTFRPAAENLSRLARDWTERGPPVW